MRELLCLDPGWAFRFDDGDYVDVAGTAFLMWLGEQITERGVGNGISLIIFSGIVAQTSEVLSFKRLNYIKLDSSASPF